VSSLVVYVYMLRQVIFVSKDMSLCLLWLYVYMLGQVIFVSKDMSLCLLWLYVYMSPWMDEHFLIIFIEF
jgi:hypothetical protein